MTLSEVLHEALHLVAAPDCKCVTIARADECSNRLRFIRAQGAPRGCVIEMSSWMEYHPDGPQRSRWLTGYHFDLGDALASDWKVLQVESGL
jgi:hypothetical protein